MHRFHIQFDSHRTTVSVDKFLSALLAIKLGHDPETPEGNRAVREWLQARLPDKVGTGKGIGKRTSQAARELMIAALVDKKVSTAYDDWVIGQG